MSSILFVRQKLPNVRRSTMLRLRDRYTKRKENKKYTNNTPSITIIYVLCIIYMQVHVSAETEAPILCMQPDGTCS